MGNGAICMGLTEHICMKCGETMPYFDNCHTCGNFDNVVVLTDEVRERMKEGR